MRTRIVLLLGRLRFFVRIGLLKVTRRGKITTLARGWMAPNVEISVSSGGQLELGYCELSSGFKLAVESQSSVRIANGVFFNRACTIVCKLEISIGSDTLFGENVKIFDHDHIHVPRLEKNKFKAMPITIGNGCWFGSNVIILKGVTVGNNVTVGANCVISKDVPPNTVVMNANPHYVRQK